MNTYYKIPNLDEKESTAYQVLLSLKKATCSDVAQKSSIKRPTLYRIFSRLIEKGLVSQIYEGKKRYFIAEHPRQLLELNNKNKNDLAKILPSLIHIETSAVERPKIKQYEGKTGIAKLYDELIKDRKEIFGFSNPKSHLSEIEFHKSFIARRMKHKIPVRLILPNDAMSRQRQKTGENELRFVRLSKKFVPPNCVYLATQNKIAMFSLKNWYTGVLIEDKSLAQGFKSFFDAFWSMLK